MPSPLSDARRRFPTSPSTLQEHFQASGRRLSASERGAVVKSHWRCRDGGLRDALTRAIAACDPYARGLMRVSIFAPSVSTRAGLKIGIHEGSCLAVTFSPSPLRHWPSMTSLPDGVTSRRASCPCCLTLDHVTSRCGERGWPGPLLATKRKGEGGKTSKTTAKANAQTRALSGISDKVSVYEVLEAPVMHAVAISEGVTTNRQNSVAG